MKLFAVLIIASFFVSCSKQKANIIDNKYVDSLISHYSLPPQVIENNKNMVFWKSRINPDHPGQVNESKYASTLITRFHEFGDIKDVEEAEIILKNINRTYNYSLASPFVALTSSAMLQHHFIQADTLLQKAKAIGIDNFTYTTFSFDVDFELGKYNYASYYLNKLKKGNDYSYYFRRSKSDHVNGEIDSAITAMLKAADLAKSSPYLRGIALSNAADLFVHSGNLQKASDLYKNCIHLNTVDFHSIMGLGWIALVHDKNYSLAEKIFKFVLTKNKLPDPLFKLYHLAQGSGNKAMEKKYAEEFVARATEPRYGKMYNKYLIEIYNGVLNNSTKAVELSKNELLNRSTPQTYAWYAYSLFSNGKNEQAYSVFKKNISGQPLEGLELYYMGKMMKGLGKGYNANEFFKAANKNHYDLSPEMVSDLTFNLKE